jgi:hypothetical protein
MASMNESTEVVGAVAAATVVGRDGKCDDDDD